MQREVTITLNEDVYEGLRPKAGRQEIGPFIERLLGSHVSERDLDEGYRAIAADDAREFDAQEWCRGLSIDMPDETR